MKRTIPFMERFTQSLFYSQKTWTSRTRKMAEVGDTFTVLAGTFQVDYVFQMPLGVVAMDCWRQEGCLNMTDFVTVWNHIHPWKGFVDSQLVWVHVFHKLEA
jgi:hypothetical protein